MKRLSTIVVLIVVVGIIGACFNTPVPTVEGPKVFRAKIETNPKLVVSCIQQIDIETFRVKPEPVKQFKEIIICKVINGVKTYVNDFVEIS